jgi:voltage-gated potassium channel
VDELYAAGADFVVSTASVGATILMNIVEEKESVYLTEGMQLFRYQVPGVMEGLTLQSARIGSGTASTVIGLLPLESDETLVLPAPDTVLKKGVVLLLMGPGEQEIESRAFPRDKELREAPGAAQR